MLSLTLRVCNGLLSLLLSSFFPPESQCPEEIVELMIDVYWLREDEEKPDDVLPFIDFS